MYSNHNLKQVESGTMQTIIILSIIGAGLCQILSLEPNVDKTVWEYDIKQQYKLFSEYFNRGDFKSLETLYTDDCIMMPPGSPQVTGREAAMDSPATTWGAGAHNLTMISLEVTAQKNRTAADRGLYILRRDDKTLYESGKFVIIWKRVKGVPKIYIDIWNSNSS